MYSRTSEQDSRKTSAAAKRSVMDQRAIQRQTAPPSAAILQLHKAYGNRGVLQMMKAIAPAQSPIIQRQKTDTEQSDEQTGDQGTTTQTNPTGASATLAIDLTPKHKRLGKKGKSTHFPNKLPKRLTSKELTKKFGNDKTKKRFTKLYKKSERAGLPDSLTEKIRKQSKTDALAKRRMTKEAKVMSGDGNPSLSKAKTQRNHIFASESSLAAYSSGVSTLMTHGTTEDERQTARTSMKKMGAILTGNDPVAVKKFNGIVDEIDSDWEDEDAVEQINKLAKLSADHQHNIDFGHDGRNMSVSNRMDVMTSPGRTHMEEKDAQILMGLESPLTHLMGEELMDELLAVPMTPGGVHIMSSKTLEEADDGMDESQDFDEYGSILDQ